MNAEELKAYVESQGYTHVSIQVYKASFRVNYWDSDAKYQRRVGIPISYLPSPLDLSKWGIWLINAFPSMQTKKEA